MNGALLNQIQASDPLASASVRANAGSGKTKTLVDRVARLLLRGARPEAILCVTFTKAAAAEMQRRLYQTLGGWAVASDETLAKALDDIDERPRDLGVARALFARALETPGGLKIQTLHGFCSELLRRFPLEAGVSPGFQVMEDAGAAKVVREARDAVARHAMAGPGPVAEAYRWASIALDFGAFESMFALFEAQREAIAAHVERCGGPAGVAADVWRACGFPDGPVEPEAVGAEALAEIDPSFWRACAAALAQGSASDISNAAKLAAVLEAPENEDAFAVALSAFFTAGGEGTPAAWVAKSAAFKTAPELREALLLEQERFEAARAAVRSARVARDSVHMLTLASAYAAAYAQAKAERGVLDFADLIDRVRLLLTVRADAAFVLYKLDGGLDHILLDEAQDTSPGQWEILRALTSEFFAGAGARPGTRTVFAVGDEKQSIFSFQGAAPERLLIEQQWRQGVVEGGGGVYRSLDLRESWRSTEQVLKVVDAAFFPPALASALQPREDAEGGPAGDVISHIAMRADHPGCVDLWPLAQDEKGEDRRAWDAPLDARGETSANRRLAEDVAGEIKALIARGDAVFDKEQPGPGGRKGDWRPARAGDVLILVRQRKALFEEILRALARSGVPAGGADRLRLGEHVLTQDLIALARFCLYPGDDLTLAALLKSPLFDGFEDPAEEALQALATGRGGRSLWRVLRERAGERAEWSAALELLTWARGQAARRTPFDFYARALGRLDGAGRSMRRRIGRRLGPEARDVLDAFLAEALKAERRGVRDLESFAADMAASTAEVKREQDEGAGAVRVMTVHGAKGLEAPIVFLPETVSRGGGRSPSLLRTEAGGFLWCTSSKMDGLASAEARRRYGERRDAEALRLLYVGLTRARDRLVVCGRIAADAKPENVGGWYAAVRDAFALPGVTEAVRTVPFGELEGLRYGPDPARLERPAPAAAPAPAPPAWLFDPAPAEPPGRVFASPSRLLEAETAAAPSPLAAAGGLGRFRRGELIHRLLQLLPDLEPARRRAGAESLLAREPGLSPAQRAEMADAALAVLQDPQFAAVFGDGSRPEVAIAGGAPDLPGGLLVSGRVDRLVVSADRVLVVDYKTNRPAPARIEDADPAYIAQMAAYVAALRAAFPGRAVEAALVWTDGPKLMAVPEKLVESALKRLARSG
jgi:ATP-dependent helicase/nuclease subunit A